jgi:shikimate dehydrogenase
MRLFGLIGYPLSHSFSKKYFTDKFQQEEIEDAQYELFEIAQASLVKDVLVQNPALQGLNVTIPHKEAVIEFLDELDKPVQSIGAVNVIKVLSNGKLKGYNSDYHGFKNSLLSFIPKDYLSIKALVLGTGGASKAVKAVLEDLQIPYKMVSRTGSGSVLSYEDITEELVQEYKLIINTSPLGMYPHIDFAPVLPYLALSSSHFLFDLVYNPEETLFMSKGKAEGAKVKNGLEMLYLQAEKAWDIWNS